MNLIPVEGERNLARDMRTNAIINTNEQEYNAYLARKNSATNEKQRIENLENQISEVKDDLNEIKMLLRRLSNGS
jgi:polyhydroxyalkanoate synthesis regulator phasin